MYVNIWAVNVICSLLAATLFAMSAAAESHRHLSVHWADVHRETSTRTYRALRLATSSLAMLPFGCSPARNLGAMLGTYFEGNLAGTVLALITLMTVNVAIAAGFLRVFSLALLDLAKTAQRALHQRRIRRSKPKLRLVG